MRTVNPNLHAVHVELDTLPLDEQLFGRIVEDLRRNGRQHVPAQAWLEAGGGVKGEDSAEKFASRELVKPWLGFGSTPITPESLFWYYQYLRDTDAMGLVGHYFDSESQWKAAARGLRVADLGTLLDINLVSPFLGSADGGPLTVIEVGGGYGRLAEAFLNVFGCQVRYVLVDAVPASLIYTYEYMTRCNPDLRVGFFYCDDPFDLDRFDCYIVPTWHVDAVRQRSYDLAVNIQSMQEMDQHHVDYYLDLFDSLLREGSGIAYFCNRRDHLFRGEWRYPDHWECLLKQCTPRSWIRDFPAEVYRKGNRSYACENQLRESLYRRELERRSTTLVEAAARRGFQPY